MKKIISLIFLGLAMLFSSAANALPDNIEILVTSSPEKRLAHVLQQLNLTQKQKKQISIFLIQMDPKFGENLVEWNENQFKLNALNPNHYDAKKIAQLADNQGKIVANAIKMRMEVRHEIYEILTPEQRKQAQRLSMSKASSIQK